MNLTKQQLWRFHQLMWSNFQIFEKMATTSEKDISIRNLQTCYVYIKYLWHYIRTIVKQNMNYLKSRLSVIRYYRLKQKTIAVSTNNQMYRVRHIEKKINREEIQKNYKDWCFVDVYVIVLSFGKLKLVFNIRLNNLQEELCLYQWFLFETSCGVVCHHDPFCCHIESLEKLS